MASEQAMAIVDLYKDWSGKLAMNGDMTLDELRELFDEWGDLSSQPENVEFREATIAGVPGVWATPEGADKSRAVICCHGGGFSVGSSKSHEKMYGHLAKALGCPTFTMDYTRAPENPHPGIVEEAVAVYSQLLDQGFKPENIGTTGDSAGGNLCTTMILYARHKGLPLPACCAPISPWYDMEGKGSTLVTNADKDALVGGDILAGMIANFLGEGGSPQDPFANPLYGDVTGFPPTLIQVGAYEVLLDDSQRFYDMAKAAGVVTELQIFPEMQHVFQFMAGNAPEADDAINKIAEFMKPHLGMK
ncbi:MAG TPA: alpha/beta hydrolase [Porticoccaceae bacterium]|nr:alpha/beta hydrolase [Porticoccaceae bacterium]HCO61165.1 alpha/beta hydrolase [Porticoccaceae bacterium]